MTTTRIPMTQSPRPAPAAAPRRTSGFTLIELMLVVAIISILATIAVPTYQDYAIRAQVTDGMTFVAYSKTYVTDYYAQRGRFGNGSNASYGLPQPASLISNYVAGVSIETATGAVSITYGQRANANIATRVLTIRPATTAGRGVVAWICAYAPTPAGLTVNGTNATTVRSKHLPRGCRP